MQVGLSGFSVILLCFVQAKTLWIVGKKARLQCLQLLRGGI